MLVSLNHFICVAVSTMVGFDMLVCLCMFEVNAVQRFFHDNETLLFVLSCDVHSSMTLSRFCLCTFVA